MMPHKKHSLLLGAHVSIAGGFEQALERGESIGCTAIQIFTKSNRQWAAKKISEEESTSFKEALKKSSVQAIMAHATYLINLAASDDAINKKSVAATIEELNRCAQLDIPYLVLHPGSYGTSDQQESLLKIAHNLDTIFESTPPGTMILLENMAGQGSSLCHRFEQLAFIRSNVVHKKRLGFCFDTCHAFAAGYDFSTEKGYEAMWHEFDTVIGLTHLKALHLNDSKKECGSNVDRHEDIGKGQLGLKAFKLIMNDARFLDVPKIVETPMDDLADHARNIETLKNLVIKRS